MRGNVSDAGGLGRTAIRAGQTKPFLRNTSILQIFANGAALASASAAPHVTCRGSRLAPREIHLGKTRIGGGAHVIAQSSHIPPSLAHQCILRCIASRQCDSITSRAAADTCPAGGVRRWKPHGPARDTRTGSRDKDRNSAKPGVSNKPQSRINRPRRRVMSFILPDPDM